MSQKQASRYCVHCDRQVLAVGQTPNHLLHLVLTLLTCGLWSIVWLLVVVASIGGYRCTRCGLSV